MRQDLLGWLQCKPRKISGVVKAFTPFFSTVIPSTIPQRRQVFSRIISGMENRSERSTTLPKATQPRNNPAFEHLSLESASRDLSWHCTAQPYTRCRTSTAAPEVLSEDSSSSISLHLPDTQKTSLNSLNSFVRMAHHLNAKTREGK